MQGRNLVPLIGGAIAAPSAPAVAELPRGPIWTPLSSRFERSLRTLRDGDWKYIKASDKRDELYHVRRDPLELENLVEKERQVRDTLRAKLEDWERQARSDVTRDPAQRLDRATRDQLKRFGY